MGSLFLSGGSTVTTVKDIRVIVAEQDFYARQAIVSYLSWDRHTRAIAHVGSLVDLLHELNSESHHIYLDAVILDTTLVDGDTSLPQIIQQIKRAAGDVAVICLVQDDGIELIDEAYHAGVRGFLSRDQVGIGISAAVRYVLGQSFVVTRDLIPLSPAAVHEFGVLPPVREYPRLTQRIEQALWLCVVEGLPAELAAEEMGVSISTVRSYIKEGYRILESADDTEYPPDMSPVERAFRRYSDLDGSRWKPAA